MWWYLRNRGEKKMAFSNIKIVGCGASGWTHELGLSLEEVDAIKRDSGLFSVKMLELDVMEAKKRAQ